jgi:hypothetical protein
LKIYFHHNINAKINTETSQENHYICRIGHYNVRFAVDTKERKSSIDDLSFIFIFGVLIPCVFVAVLPVVSALALPLLISDPIAKFMVSAFVPIFFLFIFAYIFKNYKNFLRHYGTHTNKWYRGTSSKILITLFGVLNAILFAEIILLVVLAALFYSVSEETRKSTYPYPLNGTVEEFLALEITLYITIYAIITLFTSSRYFRGDFHFVIAQKCIIEGKVHDDQDEKISHLIDGLSSYNNYLRRRFDLQFDETRVSSNIICSTSDKNQILDTIEKSFTDNPDDKLKPANCLSTFANLEPNEQFLTSKQLSTKIKEIITVLAAIVPVVIAVIQLLYPKSQ